MHRGLQQMLSILLGLEKGENPLDKTVSLLTFSSIHTHFHTLKKKLSENIVEKVEIAQNDFHNHLFPQFFFYAVFIQKSFNSHISESSAASLNLGQYQYDVLRNGLNFNPLPDMSILDSSSSTPNKDKMSKMWTNGDTDI